MRVHKYTLVHEFALIWMGHRLDALSGLARVDNTHVYHLVARDLANPKRPSLCPFSLRFSELSPCAIMEILDMNEPQRERLLKAYDVAKAAPDRLRIDPANDDELHKINDSNVVSRLRRSIGGIDDALWDRLPNLAPGQAIVSFTSLARPLLVAIDPML